MVSVACAIMVAVSVFMLLEQDKRRNIVGLALLSAAINIILLFCGKLIPNNPAFIGNIDFNKLSNPVPQALVLTAIVIGFGLLVFLTVLIKVQKHD